MQHLSDEQRKLMEWTKEQPISVYQLDPADRVVLKIADERDGIQKKTFTKWVNKHLKKHWRFIQAGRTVQDLFQDLQDGNNLLSLLEVLTGELLARERGRMRFHKVQNCNAALQFLKYRKIKVVNIRPEDIVDGNPKLTLGLIWTIILHFQVSIGIPGGSSESEQQFAEVNAREARNALLVWVRDIVKGYPGVQAKDFSRSWRDGLAFNALLHRYRPNMIDFRAAKQRSNRENLEIAFGIAEKEFAVTRLLDAEDVDTPEPDDKSVITYVSSLYDALSVSTPQLETLREERLNTYVDQASALHTWITTVISRLHGRYESSSPRETQSLLAECAAYRTDELPRKLDLKNVLSELFHELENLYINVPSVPVKEDIQPATLDKLWRMLVSAIDHREEKLRDDLRRCEKLRPLAEKTQRSVLEIDLGLKSLREQMKQDEQRIRSLKNPYEAKKICDTYDNGLREIDITIRSTLNDAKTLREQRYYDCETIYRSVLEVEKRYISIRTLYQEGIIAQVSGKTFTSEEKLITKRTERISSTRLVDHQELMEDTSLSDDTLSSHSTDGSFYFSPPVSTLKNHPENLVVQISSYKDRENAHPKDRSSDRRSGSSLVHTTTNWTPESDRNGDSADKKRSRSLLTYELGNETPSRIAPHSNGAEPKSDKSTPDKRVVPGRYYFGASPSGDHLMEDDSLKGRRGSEADGARKVEATVSVGMSQRTNGTPLSNGVSSSPVQSQESSRRSSLDVEAAQRKARADSLKQKASQVMIQLDTFSQGLVGLENKCTELNQWISSSQIVLQNNSVDFSRISSIQQAQQEQNELHKGILARASDVKSLQKEIEEAKNNSKGLMSLLNEYRAYMEGAPPPIYAKSNELNILINQTSSNYDKLCSDASASQQNLQCLTDLLSAFQAHLDEAVTWISNHERQVFEAETLPKDKAGIELAKHRFQELSRQTGEFQNQMDRLAAIGTDIQMRTGNKADHVKTDGDQVQARWIKLKDACHDRMRSLDSVSFFLHSCEQILTYLIQKQKMISVLGPISYDAALLEHQKQQVNVLLEELRAQRPQITKLHDESGHLLSQTKESERASLIAKLNAVEDLWTELVHQLEGRHRQIENATFASQIFVEALQVLESWLGKITSSYERFVHDNDGSNSERQLSELKDIENELHAQVYLVGNTENAAATLCEVLANDVTASEINSKVENAKKQYGDLKKRNESLKNSLENNVKQGKEFDLLCEDMKKWISSVNVRMRPDVKISALPDVLDHQLQAFEDVRSEIFQKEPALRSLVNHGKEMSNKAPSDLSSSIQVRLEAVQDDWQDVNKRAADRNTLLQNSKEQVKRYQAAAKVFLPWLAKVEVVVEGFTPVSFRKEENAKQLAEVQDLRQEINVYSSDYDVFHAQGNGLLEVCTADIDGVKADLAHAEQKWEEIGQVSVKRARSLEDVSHRLTEYDDAMDTLQDGLSKSEKKLKEADEAEADQRAMDKLTSLQDEVESMKRQIDLVEDLGHGLLADGGQSDVSHIEADLATVRNRYDDLESKIGESLTFLEGATVAVSRFVEYLKQTENVVNELEDELENMAPEGKDVETLFAQIDEVGHFKKKIEATVDEVQDADSALNDLVENQYAPKPDQWKDQIENMFHQLDDLMTRADHRASDLDIAREKLEDFQSTLASVMQSLSDVSGEDGVGQVSTDRKGNHIHEQFFQRLEGMLAALSSTADKLANCEPISAIPMKIQKQMAENTKLIEDLSKRSHAYEAAKRAANDLGKLATTPEDQQAMGSIQNQLANLDDMWITILKDAEDRGRSLENTHRVAERFWEDLKDLTETIKEFESVLLNQEPPAVEEKVIKSQQDTLQELKEELHTSVEPGYAQVVNTGQELIDFVGEPDKPEVKKSIEELDHAWGNITQLFLQRDTDLVDAMEKSMAFHQLLQSLMEFLEKAEDDFSKMGSIGAETDTVKAQMEQLKEFRAQMEPHTVDVESLMAQADELVMRTSEEQAAIVNVPVDEIKQRWDMLCEDMNERQYELENQLVQLGQFRHALNELVAWIVEKDSGLDSWTIPFGDSKIIELEMAKHKVLLNDLFANQNSIDILNEAGQRIIEASEGGEDVKQTELLVDDMNQKWQELLQKADLKQSLLEERLREAENFQDEITDKLNWLTEKDQHLIASRPVGGLPQSAKDQLAHFMELFNEMEATKPEIENILKRGTEYLETAPENTSAGLDHNLKTLKHRWDAAITKANDRKIKLEIAVRDAVEFYDQLQAFTLWLTNAERTLATAKAPSRIMDEVLAQIEEHKTFQEDLGEHLAAQNALDKKGTTLKYFSQKQDVVQIKNLLASVQMRWDKLVSASADRQRSLNSAYTEGKEFNKHYAEMSEWIDSVEKSLDNTIAIPNDTDKIKGMLLKHKEFQKQLTAKQSALNGISKMGRMLKETAAKGEQGVIQGMLVDLQKKWKNLGSKAAERQRKLEEALLFRGQLKDALQSMLDWLNKVEPLLSESSPVHGDLDNVNSLNEHHKAVEADLANRAANIAAVRKAGNDLKSSSDPDQESAMIDQLATLDQKWATITDLSSKRRTKLNDALVHARDFDQLLHSLIQWLGETEMKARVFKSLPEDVTEAEKAVREIRDYQMEMHARQGNYDRATTLGAEIQEKCHPDSVATMRHWLKVLNTRWQEVDLLLKQREQRLKDHMSTLEKDAGELEHLLVWFFSAEANLIAASNEDLPYDLDLTKRFMAEHQDFETELYGHQMTVERLTQARPGNEQTMLDKKGRRIPMSTRKPGEPVFASDNARDLYYRNKHVTNLAVERRNRLQDHLSYMLELEKLKGFQFDDWRRRFVKYMNVKKDRVMDFFRRYDTDADGRMTRDEFIDCILNYNFQTTPMEMQIVADIFDANKDGYIDYQEFVQALKPRNLSTLNLTDADKIDDELTFQVQNCTCKHHYQVQQVGENKYIFGESQKLRLVRILRSVVMVRVGGGWQSLDEFLVKNDPCRAKGRTNIELRERSILPEGASQAMTPFKTKAGFGDHGTVGVHLINQPNQRPSSIGPITKIREKTVNTTPWRAGTKNHETSSEPSTTRPHTHSHIPHSHTHSHMVSSAPNGRPKAQWPKTPAAIRTGSQPSSRPPSRAASEAPEEQPSHSSHSTHSTHSRSSSISNLSATPSLASAKTTSSGPHQNGSGTKATSKLNGNYRKR